MKWKHLRDIPFSSVSKKDRVDFLIGVDHVDLHQSLQEVHGKKGEPIARLTPLGWTCVGRTTRSSNTEDSYFTFFSVDLDSTLRRFWEIEQDTIEMGKESMSQEETVTLEKTQQSIVDRDGMYEVSIPWKENKDTLPNNYSLALNRLVFGVNASPFLAQFVARHNALKYAEEFPVAAETVMKSTYMDDNMDLHKQKNRP